MANERADQKRDVDFARGSQEANRGIQAVADALVLEDFPMDRHELDYAVGDIEIESGVPVRELTDRMRQESFSSPEEAIEAIRALAPETPMPIISREHLAPDQDASENVGGIADVRDDEESAA